MPKSLLSFLAVAALAVLTSQLQSSAADQAPGLPSGYKLLYEQNFEKPSALNDFVFTDPKAWRLSQGDGTTALELTKQSDYKPEHRSPLNIALIADKVFGDFILEVSLLSTKEPYGHQDMCVFFGFTGPAKFYYNHIAVAPDPNAHNLFIVNEAPRKNFAKEVSKGVTWGKEVWHKVRIERKLADGSIKVFFDDMTKPIIVGEDKTFAKGGIGFGSFDDIGKMDNIRIWGPSVETKKTEFFSKP
jgi:hypothetical protein